MTTAYGSVWVEHGIVSKMVLASAAGTGPIFPGAPAPPDVNVANPTRPGIRLPCSETQNKKRKANPTLVPGNPARDQTRPTKHGNPQVWGKVPTNSG